MLEYLWNLIKSFFVFDTKPSSTEVWLDKKSKEKEKELKAIEKEKENIDEDKSVSDNIDYFNNK